MNDTPGIEEELKTRISEIVNKDLSKRQVEKIVELFAPDKANPLYRVVDEKSFRNWFFENFTERGDDELNHVNIAPHDLCKELYKYFQFKHSLPVSDEGWISVENQLPPIGEEVIVYCPECRKKITALARLIRYEGAINFYWDNSYGGSNIHVQTSVTHWRKLPNKPNSK